MLFTPESVVLHKYFNENRTDETSSLQVYIYVLLPEGAVRSPFRKTDYVIPQDTLDVIVVENRNTIGAMVRDTIHSTVHSFSDAWRQLAISLIVIVLVVGTLVLFAVIANKIHKEHLKRKGLVFLLKGSRTVSSANPPHSAVLTRTLIASSPYSNLASTSSSLTSSTLTPPSTSGARHHTPSDSCSLMAVSDGSSSAGHGSSSTGSCMHVTNPIPTWSRKSITQRLTAYSSWQERSRHPLAVSNTNKTL